MDLLPAVRHIKALDPGIGAKKLTARVKQDFPHLATSGIRVGTKEIREALSLLASEPDLTSHSEDKENFAAPGAPGMLVACSEPEPSPRASVTGTLASAVESQERVISASAPAEEPRAESEEKPAPAGPESPKRASTAEEPRAGGPHVTEMQASGVPEIPEVAEQGRRKEEVGERTSSRQSGAEMKAITKQPKLEPQSEHDPGEEQGASNAIAPRRWQGWNAEAAALRGQRVATAASVRKCVELRRLATRARGNPVKLRFVREQMRLHNIR